MKRIQKLQKKIASAKLSALLVVKPENVRYLCGFVGSNGRLLVTPKKATLITDFRYLRSGRKQIPRQVDVFDQKDGLKKLMGRYKTIGFEPEQVSVSALKAYKKDVKDVAWKPVSGLVEQGRILKDAAEMKVMRKAVDIANKAYLKLLKKVKIGVSEDELEWELLSVARKLGAEGFSFTPIICFGKNTADVHHVKEDNKLKKGESVLIDMGIEYQGYMTDMTRTVFLSEPSKKMREIYETVLEANKKAIAGIKVGMTTGQVDKIARDHIKAAGYGDYFGHSTGHGVGMEVHEAPTVGVKSKTKIEPGMVFTVEPGIYLNHLGGVRIEDMVYINAKGKPEVLTTPAKHLQIIKSK